jgi:CheY-like chemotaxis protein
MNEVEIRGDSMQVTQHIHAVRTPLPSTIISAVYIDDDPYMAKIISHFCERCGGVRVKSFSSGGEALKWLSQNSIDVIVSAYYMRGINGLEFFKILRARGNETPFIIFFRGVELEGVAMESISSSFHSVGDLLNDDGLPNQIPTLVDMIVQAATYRQKKSGDQ